MQREGHPGCAIGRGLAGLTAVALAAVLLGAAASASLAGERWFRGNLHGHTTNSDGKLPPEEAALWYRDHGYHFCVITDHRRLTPVEPLAHLQTPEFIVLPGIELDSKPEGRNVHTCGINIRREIGPQGGETVSDALQRQVDAIRAAGGVAMINHPNWTRAFNAEEVLPVRGAALLEIYNMSSGCENEGDPASGLRSTEQMWDWLLTRGVRIWGTATDDVHTYVPGHPDGPGKGWVMVRARKLTPAAIASALERGDFYASTGVELSEVRRGGEGLVLKVRPMEGLRYRIELIGPEGRLLEVAHGPSARFDLSGRSWYVRARVVASDGSLALLQPVFLDSRPAE